MAEISKYQSLSEKQISLLFYQNAKNKCNTELYTSLGLKYHCLIIIYYKVIFQTQNPLFLQNSP
jgi:hypothetical protein